MRKLGFSVLAAAILAVFSVGSAFAADPILYLDFDDQDDLVLNTGDQYVPTFWYERATSVTAVFADAIGSGADTVDIRVPDGDGTNLPNTEGPQGGKALLIESGGYEECLNVEMSSPYHLGDYTVEAAFWLSTNNLAGNTVALQNIWCSSWPSGSRVHNELRVIGNAAAVGRGADDRHIEMCCWQADGTEVRVSSLAEISAQTWHTAQFLFDYNEGDPAASSFSFYLDGTLQGSATYDAAVTGAAPEDVVDHFWGAFGTPATDGSRKDIGSWRFFLGGSQSRQISFTDNRGVKGAIDAFVISEGLLAPSEFVLTVGFDPGPPPIPTPIPTPTPVVVFESPMDSGASADFTSIGSPDVAVTFGYDWGSEVAPTSTGWTTIPASPGGDTVGLKLEVNNTDDATDYEEALAVYAKALPSTRNYDIEFDAFCAYPVPLDGGGAGSTEHIGIVVQSSGTKIATIRDDALDNVNPATPGAVADVDANGGMDIIDQDGIAFGYTGDYGEAASNIFCFDPSTRAEPNGTASLDGQVGTWLGGDPLPTAGHAFCDDAGFFGSLAYPVGRTEAIANDCGTNSATPGWVWNRIKAEVRGAKVTFYVNDVPFVEAFSSSSDLAAGIIATDPFNSFSDPAVESFMLIDNFRIVEFPAPLAAQNWYIYE